MSALGDVLELLHDAGERWRTSRLTIRDWYHHERSRLATDRLERSASTRQIMLFGHGHGPGPTSEEHESLVRIWIDADRAREEREGDDAYASLAIRDGDRWWMYSPRDGARTNDGDRDQQSGVGEQALRLLEPAYVLAGLKLEPAGESEVAGRPTIRVLARDRGDDRETGMHHFRLGYGADEYELHVDRERGVLLRAAALLDGEPFAVTEVTEIAFDEDFPAETFVFELPEGESFRPLQHGMHTTLEAAAADAPFTVLAPERIPDGWQLHVHALQASGRPSVPATVALHYHSPDAAHQLNLQQTAVGAADQLDWIEWEQRGDLLVSRPDAPVGSMLIWARVEAHGTRVTLSSSDLGLDALTALARSLVPAPTEPPSFG